MKHYVWRDEEKGQKLLEDAKKKLIETQESDSYERKTESWRRDLSFFALKQRLEPKYLVFVALGEFRVIEYDDFNKPFYLSNEIEFAEEVVKKFYKDHKSLKVRHRYFRNTEFKSIWDEDFRKEKNRDFLINKIYCEINYAYLDSRSRPRVISTDLIFPEVIGFYDNFIKSYNELQDKFKHNKDVLDSANLIYERTQKVYFTEKTVVRSIDHLIKTMKHELQE